VVLTAVSGARMLAEPPVGLPMKLHLISIGPKYHAKNYDDLQELRRRVRLNSISAVAGSRVFKGWTPPK
jgi:hypothetical protein